jgi:hypothetical protein
VPADAPTPIAIPPIVAHPTGDRPFSQLGTDGIRPSQIGMARRPLHNEIAPCPRRLNPMPGSRQVDDMSTIAPPKSFEAGAGVALEHQTPGLPLPYGAAQPDASVGHRAGPRARTKPLARGRALGAASKALRVKCALIEVAAVRRPRGVSAPIGPPSWKREQRRSELEAREMAR